VAVVVVLWSGERQASQRCELQAPVKKWPAAGPPHRPLIFRPSRIPSSLSLS